MKSRARLCTVTFETVEKIVLVTECYNTEENLIRQLFIFLSLLEGTVRTS